MRLYHTTEIEIEKIDVIDPKTAQRDKGGPQIYVLNSKLLLMTNNLCMIRDHKVSFNYKWSKIDKADVVKWNPLGEV